MTEAEYQRFRRSEREAADPSVRRLNRFKKLRARYKGERLATEIERTREKLELLESIARGD